MITVFINDLSQNILNGQFLYLCLMICDFKHINIILSYNFIYRIKKSPGGPFLYDGSPVKTPPRIILYV